MVLQGRTPSIGDRIDGLTLDVSDMPAFCEQVPFINGEDQVDDVYANHNDHDEGFGRIFKHNCV